MQCAQQPRIPGCMPVFVTSTFDARELCVLHFLFMVDKQCKLRQKMHSHIKRERRKARFCFTCSSRRKEMLFALMFLISHHKSIQRGDRFSSLALANTKHSELFNSLYNSTQPLLAQHTQLLRSVKKVEDRTAFLNIQRIQRYIPTAKANCVQYFHLGRENQSNVLGKRESLQSAQNTKLYFDSNID